MRREDFTSNAPGRLVTAPEGHLAFVPDPLPPHLDLTPATINLLVDAERAVGELNGIGRRGLPNPHLLINPFLWQEAVLSSRIEGTTATLQDLLLFEAAPHREPEQSDVREVANYVAALELGFSLLDNIPICLRLIRDVHARLMQDVRGHDQRPGEFRHIPVQIGRRGVTPATATFVPPPVKAMHEALDSFERYIGAQGTELPFLVQLALAHYQFEAIHPFTDGNGRVGRLLIALQLREREYLAQPLLYLSAYFERHRDAYYDHLLGVSQQGAWSPWIDFFLRGVAEQARDAIQLTDRLLDLQRTYQSWALTERRSGNLARLTDFLFERPIVSIADVMAHLSVTRRAADQLVQRLVDRGMLVEVTGRQRDREFAAREIVAILEASDVGTIPE
jgi:Fic family protein